MRQRQTDWFHEVVYSNVEDWKENTLVMKIRHVDQLHLGRWTLYSYQAIIVLYDWNTKLLLPGPKELQYWDFLTDQGFHLRLKILTTLINDMYHVGFLRRRLRHIIVKKKNRIIEFCVDHGWSCETWWSLESSMLSLLYLICSFQVPSFIQYFFITHRS